MQGTVKFFNTRKGFGFITPSDGTDYFVHHQSIIMKGFHRLDADDIVDFEIGTDTKGRTCAINVHPILTRNMVNKALRKEDLHLKTTKDAFGYKAYMVVDANNVIQTGENGMSLIDVAAFAGIDTEGLEEHEEDNEIMMNEEQTIDKIMEEYSEYGIEKWLAEQIYDLAIQNGVADELIYPGMKMIFNNALGIDNTDVIKEVGEGFTQYAVNDTRKSNPTATDKVIAKNMKEELADGFDWKSLEMPNGIVNAIKDATEQFIKNNK